MYAKMLESWQGQGFCAIFELNPPLEGHKFVAYLQWYGIGKFRKGFFPCDGTREGIDESNFVGPSGKTIEDLGYEVLQG